MIQIKKLTKEQENLMPVWADMWIKKGLQTGETDWKTFEKYISVCYEKAQIKFPNRIIQVQSPIIGALSASIAEAILRGGAVDGAVDGAVRGAVDGAVDDAVRGAVDKIKNLKWHYWLGGQFWVGGWYWGTAYSDFFITACKLKVSKDIMERFTAYKKINESVNYWWPNKNFVIVCARPVQIYRNQQGRLHCENDMAIKYPDGWGLWMLNGVKVNKQIVMTPADQLDCNLVLHEKNVQIRTEIIKKIGMDRIIKELGAKTIDQKIGKAEYYSNFFSRLFNRPKQYKYEYELLNFDCIDGRFRPYLKMINPSTGEEHVEGVHPDCNTIEKALAWRDGENSYEMPAIMT